MSLVVLALIVALEPQTLTDIRAEPNITRRATLAMDYAFRQLAECRQAAGTDAFQPAAEQVVAGAELVLETLSKGKRNVGLTKKMEVRARELVRRAEALQRDLPIDDREPFAPKVARLTAIQDALLRLILGRER